MQAYSEAGDASDGVGAGASRARAWGGVARAAKSRSLACLRRQAALGMTPGARGRRAGGSEDPPLQLAGVERAAIGMVDAAGSAALAAIDKCERTQRGAVLERLVDMEVSRKKA